MSAYEIIERAAMETGVEPTALKGHDRKTKYTVGRFAAIWAIRERCKISYPGIGRMFGGRDHSTIIHACKRAAEFRETNEEFRGLTDRLFGITDAGRRMCAEDIGIDLDHWRKKWPPKHGRASVVARRIVIEGPMWGKVWQLQEDRTPPHVIAWYYEDASKALLEKLAGR